MRLPLVVGEQKHVVAGGALPGEEPVERGEDEVCALPVLLAAPGQSPVESRIAVLVEGVERLLEDGEAIGLDHVEQRPAIQPHEAAEELGGRWDAATPGRSPLRALWLLLNDPQLALSRLESAPPLFLLAAQGLQLGVRVAPSHRDTLS